MREAVDDREIGEQVNKWRERKKEGAESDDFGLN